MHKDRGGECVELQGLKCHLPKQPPLSKIDGHHLPKHKQKWTPTPLPSFKARDIKVFSNEKYDPDQYLTWEECEREEYIGMTGYDPWDVDKSGNERKVTSVMPNLEYRCPQLSKFRNQELDRIQYGYWFMLNGKPTYLTGTTYAYFNWWKMDVGLPDYRDYIRELGYVVDLVESDPTKLGVILASMRGIGKSYWGTCVVYFKTIFKRKAFSGIQSMGDTEAEELYTIKLTQPVNDLPSFLVPIHGWLANNIPNKMEFNPPVKQHKNVKFDKWLRKRATYASITYRNAKDRAYDGTTTTVLLQDEIGKISKKVGSVTTRFEVARFCVYRGNVKRGIIFGFTTVGEMERGGGEEFKRLYYDSDQNNPEVVTESGWTNSGCVKYFISALDATELDEFGMPDREKAKKHHDELRDNIYKQCVAKGDMSAYISYCQNNPYTEEEAFMTHNKECLFNEYILQRVLAELSRVVPYEEGPVRRGDLEWVVKWRSVKFVENPVNGHWELSTFPDGQIWKANNIRLNGDFIFPTNEAFGRIGYDPVSVDKDKLSNISKASDAAITVRSLFIYNWNDEYCNTPIAHYRHRPLKPKDAHEEAAKACIFFSCPILIEKNMVGALHYFEENMLGGFIMRRPEETFTTYGTNQGTPGVAGTRHIINYYTLLAKTDIQDHGLKLKFKKIVKDAIEFDVDNTTRYDSFVSYGLSLIASEKPAKTVVQETDITKFYM